MPEYQEIYDYVIDHLTSAEINTQDQLRTAFDNIVSQYRAERGLSYVFENRADQAKMFAHIVSHFLDEDVQDIGLGPLELILADPQVVEIMINGLKGIFVDRDGDIVKSEHHFSSNEEIMQVIDRIVTPVGRQVNESNPIVDVRLEDGSRVNIVIPPIALDGPLVTIRKFLPNEMTWDNMLADGTISEPALKFLDASVSARLNIVISGGQGSGKTTLLNNLMTLIADDERVIAVESASELRMESDQFLRLEARPANLEGRGEVSLSTLVNNARKMRPDRIILGDVMGREGLDIMQAMNTGMNGSMFTISANTPRDMLARLETVTSLAEPSIPVRGIREQMASAVDLIVQIQRLRDGSRKILSITEVTGMTNNLLTMQTLFEFNQTDFVNGKVMGQLEPTGIIPNSYELLSPYVPKSLFTAPHETDA